MAHSNSPFEFPRLRAGVCCALALSYPAIAVAGGWSTVPLPWQAYGTGAIVSLAALGSMFGRLSLIIEGLRQIGQFFRNRPGKD